jgi:hypothetical protein
MQTTNDIVATSRPFRSRFIEFSLPPYSYEEFYEIAVKLAATIEDVAMQFLMALIAGPMIGGLF